MEFREDANEMILYFGSIDNAISFENGSDEWDEVYQIETINEADNNSNDKRQKMKKCLNLYEYERKVCLIRYEKQGQEDEQLKEYRVTIKKHEKTQQEAMQWQQQQQQQFEY